MEITRLTSCINIHASINSHRLRSGSRCGCSHEGRGGGEKGRFPRRRGRVSRLRAAAPTRPPTCDHSPRRPQRCVRPPPPACWASPRALPGAPPPAPGIPAPRHVRARCSDPAPRPRTGRTRAPSPASGRGSRRWRKGPVPPPAPPQRRPRGPTFQALGRRSAGTEMRETREPRGFPEDARPVGSPAFVRTRQQALGESFGAKYYRG